jgi:drug/metabolite transporter (DMT)-like permease
LSTQAFVVGGAGYLAIVGATRTGEVAAVVPFRYTRLVFAMLFGVLVFGERPGPLMLAGAALAVADGAVYYLARDRHPATRPAGGDGRPGDGDMVTVN